MPMYGRRRSFSRSVSRRRFIRKTRRGVGPRGFVKNRQMGRLFRRTMARRPVVPEVKYIDVSNLGNTLNPATSVTFPLSPTVLTRGVGEGQRIGNTLMYRKLMLKWNFAANFNAAAAANPNIDSVVRMMCWTPRVDYVIAARYMAQVGLLDHIDYNAVTIHKDFRFLLGSIISASGNGPYVGPAVPNHREFDMRFMFPRKLHFSPLGVSGGDIDTIDVDKDIMYCTLVLGGSNTSSPSIGYSVVSRVTYIDA